MKANIIEIANGLQTVEFQLWAKLGNSFGMSAGQKSLLQHIYETVKSQASEIVNSTEYKEAVRLSREEYDNSDLGQFLKNSNGMSGFNIMMNLKSA